MAIVLGLLVALFYGSGDFFGGVAAKRTPAVTVVTPTNAIGTAVYQANRARPMLMRNVVTSTRPQPAAKSA